MGDLIGKGVTKIVDLQYYPKKIDDLFLITSAKNSLKRIGIISIDDLLKVREEDLRWMRGIGDKFVDNIKSRLAIYGLKLKP